jgi:hypothetical protein
MDRIWLGDQPSQTKKNQAFSLLSLLMDTKLLSRLDLLADNSLSIVFERNRLKELK